MSRSARWPIVVHPDDESLGLGGILAHYSNKGIETHVLTATRGEAGRYFDNQARPSEEEVGRVREAELRAAARELGVHDVTLVTFGQDGAYGHPDHIAISQLTNAAVVAAADAAYQPEQSPHRVSKLYYFGWPQETWDL